jgi:hypothetical protein
LSVKAITAAPTTPSATASLPPTPPATATSAPPAAATPTLATTRAAPAALPYATLSAAAGWRPDTTVAIGGDLALGLQLGSAWLALEGSARAPTPLATLAPEATRSALGLGLALGWSPPRPIAPTLGARAGLRHEVWSGAADEAWWLARAGVDGGIRARVSPSLDLLALLRADLDLDPTYLHTTSTTATLSPLDLGATLGLRVHPKFSDAP